MKCFILSRFVERFGIKMLISPLKMFYFATDFQCSASTEESVFVIGGYAGHGFISIIAEFKDRSWVNAGRLRKVFN